MRSSTPDPGTTSSEVRLEDHDGEPGEQKAADAIDEGDPHKVEKLTKLGHAGDDTADASE